MRSKWLTLCLTLCLTTTGCRSRGRAVERERHDVVECLSRDDLRDTVTIRWWEGPIGDLPDTLQILPPETRRVVVTRHQVRAAASQAREEQSAQEVASPPSPPLTKNNRRRPLLIGMALGLTLAVLLRVAIAKLSK